MVRPDFKKRGQSPKEIPELSVAAEHKRTRERFQALYMIGTGQTNASQWAERIDRQNVTVINWAHRYNAEGPDRLVYRHSGGRTPLLR